MAIPKILRLKHNFFYVVFNCAGIRKNRVTTIAVLLLLRPFLIFFKSTIYYMGARADHGSCIVTTYKTNNLHERRKEIKEKEIGKRKEDEGREKYTMKDTILTK